MAEKKSVVEEALLDIKKIQEALKNNTKEILRTVAVEEINGMIKESLLESDYEEETVSDEDGESSEETSTSDEGGETETDTEVDVEDNDSDDEEEVDIQAPEEVGGDQEDDMDIDMSGGDELDMTGASDDDVIAIYRKLSGDDEIEIVGDEIHLNISEPGQYIVKKGGLSGGAMPSAETGDEFGGDEFGGDEFGGEEGSELGGAEGGEFGGAEGGEFGGEEGDEFGTEVGAEGGAEGGSEFPEEETEEEPIYEIEMDDEETVTEGDEEVTEGEEDEEETVTEGGEEDEETIEEKISIGTGMSVGSHRNKTVNSTGAGSNPKIAKESIASKKVLTETVTKYKALLKESAELKRENEEFRLALKQFRHTLVETVVFNSNLSYVAKLFIEHSTTKDEKKKIIERFDNEVSNLKESKKLYKTIVSELETRKPMNESIETKINKVATTGGSKQLNEVTAYVDPSTQRIKDLISRVENKDKY